MKFYQNREIWLKLWNLVNIVKFDRNCEIWSKLWNLVKLWYGLVKILKLNAQNRVRHCAQNRVRHCAQNRVRHCAVVKILKLNSRPLSNQWITKVGIELLGQLKMKRRRRKRWIELCENISLVAVSDATFLQTMFRPLVTRRRQISTKNFIQFISSSRYDICAKNHVRGEEEKTQKKKKIQPFFFCLDSDMDLSDSWIPHSFSLFLASSFMRSDDV